MKPQFIWLFYKHKQCDLLNFEQKAGFPHNASAIG